MKPLHEYKAAIFDLDGTLVDSLHVWDDICRVWLQGKGHMPPPTLEADIAMMTLTQSAAYVRREFGIKLPPERIIGEWQDMVLWRYEQELQLKPGAGELLAALAGQGIKLALATSCFPAACQALLRRYNLRQMFDAIVYSDEIGQDKSQPDIWLACAARLSIAPADCVVFEDMRPAGSGIRAAGMGFVSVRDNHCKDWSLMQQEADLALADISEWRQYWLV